MNTELIGNIGAAIFVLGISTLYITAFSKYISLIIEAFQDKEWGEFCVLIGCLLTVLGLIIILI